MDFPQKSPTVIISPSTPDDELKILIDKPRPPSPSSNKIKEASSVENHKCSSECILRYPIHHACRRGNFLELKSMLLDNEDAYCGSYSPLELDCNLRTPLHYAAAADNCEKGLMCVKELLASSKIVPPSDDKSYNCKMMKKFLNYVDKNGETALHLAAKNEAHHIVVLLLKHWADYNIRMGDGHTTQLCLIYFHVPSALCYLMKQSISFVSNCQCEKGDDFTEKILNWHDYDNNDCRTTLSYICLNFAPVLGFMNLEGNFAHPETQFLFDVNNKKMAGGQRKDVLSNILAQSFLHLKWQKLKWFCYSAIFFHLFWLTLYIGLAIDIFAVNCPYSFPPIRTQNKINDFDSLFESTDCKMTTGSQTGMIILTVMSILITLKEITQLHRLGTLYFTFENFGQIILLALIFQTVPQVLFESSITSLNYQISAFGIFLAWALMLCQLSKIPRIDKRLVIFNRPFRVRFPNHGVYIEILCKVFKNVMVFIIIFSPLLLGFGFSFRILLPEQKEFSSPLPNMMKLIVMMTGELEYDQVFNNEDKSAVLIFEAASHIFYLVFVIVATMILFNLLIGFTVSDICGLQKDAAINQVSNKLEQMYLMESFLLSNKMQNLFKIFQKITGRGFGLESSIKVVARPAHDLYNPSFSCFHTTLFHLPEEHRMKIRYLASHNTIALADITDKLSYPVAQWTGGDPAAVKNNAAWAAAFPRKK